VQLEVIHLASEELPDASKGRPQAIQIVDLPIDPPETELSTLSEINGTPDAIIISKDWKIQFLTKCTEALSGENRILIPLAEEIGTKK
jgi:hypothetical protein